WMTRLGKACEEAGSSFRILDYKKAFHVAKTSEFLQGSCEILKGLNQSAKPQTIAGATEASVFSRLGLECLVFGPGKSLGNSHAPDEKVSIDDLELAIEFYKKAIERFCL
ncbi:MAG: M20/M25/M40 family metallo-hydrolase, partial [Bdellovibrionales bacterium]|nr:M20/M25/M40 family metallo-hydrolase [Bdellovibrionales bacterium]